MGATRARIGARLKGGGVVMANIRGPKPKPDVIRVLEGNPGKRPIRDNVGLPPSENLKPPSFLPADAKNEWKRVVHKLAGVGLLTDLDLSALAAYCQSYATWLEAIKRIKELGMIVKSPNGYPMPNPYIKIQRDAQSEMLSWLREFGMTPSARTRVDIVTPDEEVDEIEELLKWEGEA